MQPFGAARAGLSVVPQSIRPGRSHAGIQVGRRVDEVIDDIHQIRRAATACLPSRFTTSHAGPGKLCRLSMVFSNPSRNHSTSASVMLSGGRTFHHPCDRPEHLGPHRAYMLSVELEAPRAGLLEEPLDVQLQGPALRVIPAPATAAP